MFSQLIRATVDKINSNPALSIATKYGICLGGCLIVHQIVSKKFNIRKKTKWYLIHTVGNAVITGLSVKDMILTTRDPLNSVNNYADAFALTNLSTYPVVIMSSIHLYHILLYFREMVLIDWIHHLASGGFVGSICTFYIKGSIVNHGLFFMCGFPGGVDYLMLTLNDIGLIDRMTEKRVNRYLNMYIRLPGILFNCYAGLINYLYQPEPFCHISVGALIFLLNVWNATYFAHRVVENYGYTSAKLDKPSTLIEQA